MPGSASARNEPGGVIAPGATIGMLGGGQLGRMFALAARRMGYGVQIFGDAPNSPAGQIADRTWTVPFEDHAQLRLFAEQVDVVTYEQENIPVETVEVLQQHVPVRPSGSLLEASQHRIREKTALRNIGIATADFHPVTSVKDLNIALADFRQAGILKTVTLGYDGKGQARITPGTDAAALWRSLGVSEAILEREISFAHELSVVASRFADGTVVPYQATLNHHVNHILDLSVSPSAAMEPRVMQEACDVAAAILEHFCVVGVICVEYFLTSSGRLLVNEIAPRPHNSGHLTIDACGSSQFEQQVRAVCGLASGDVRQRQPAAMVNLLGEHLAAATPERWQVVFSRPEVHVHLYGKAEARPGRKMGHLTVLADTAAAAAAAALAARSVLTGDDLWPDGPRRPAS